MYEHSVQLYLYVQLFVHVSIAYVYSLYFHCMYGNDCFLYIDTRLFLSSSGTHGLLVSSKLELYLWECREGSSMWWVLLPPNGVQLPKPENKERTVDAVFHTHTVS